MPVINKPDDAKRSANAMADIAERLSEMVEAKSKQREINGWLFIVNRDAEGFITTVEAEPK
jgi:hypothetical protein